MSVMCLCMLISPNTNTDVGNVPMHASLDFQAAARKAANVCRVSRGGGSAGRRDWPTDRWVPHAVVMMIMLVTVGF